VGIKKGLGKGLQSLIPKKRLEDKNRKGNWIRPEKESIFYIEIDKIKPNPFQPRRNFSKSSLKELSNSIREQGILQPLLVTKIEKPTERGQDVEYYVIAGERRLRAAKMAGLTQVPVIIRPAVGYQKLELALIENIQREDLNPIEQARALKRLKEEYGITYKEIAEKLGKSEVSIINTVRLLKLPLTVQKGVYEGKITEGHARAILMAKPKKRLSLYYKTIKNNGKFLVLVIRDNIFGKILGKIFGFRPHNLRYVLDLLQTSGFEEIEVMDMKDLRGLNKIKICVISRKTTISFRDKHTEN